MRLRLGHPTATLIIAPHADDEAIAACALIVALRRRTRLSILVVTDGAASHPGSRLWPRRRLVAERRRESRRAMRRLGLPACALEFLGLADGELSADPTPCAAAIARAISRRRDVRLLVAPAADDAHPDHRTIALAVDAARFPGRRLTYRVWPSALRTGRRSALPAPALRLTKRSIVRGYRTQTGAITDAARGFTMSRREFAGFTRPIEFFRETRR